MYEVNLDETWELFGDYLSGARSGSVLVASADPLGDEARAALSSSAASLGYGADACTFAAVRGLDPQALFLLVEGIDPQCLIIADGGATSQLEHAYRCTIPTGAPVRVFGRSAVAFLDFADLLSTPESKQLAWALLKKLPRVER